MNIVSSHSSQSLSILDSVLDKNKEASNRLEHKLEQLMDALGSRPLDILLVGGAGLSQVQAYLKQQMATNVRHAETGQLALECFTEDFAELVVVDSQLSDMSASEFLKQVRELAEDEPMATIVVAQYQEDIDRVRSASSADSAIKRPMLVKDFITVVKQLYNLKSTGEFQVLVQKPK